MRTKARIILLRLYEKQMTNQNTYEQIGISITINELHKNEKNVETLNTKKYSEIFFYEGEKNV